jgi:hypothetical protein
MNDNDFAIDALNRLREETKGTTDKLGIQLADTLFNLWTKDPSFKNISSSLKNCPTFLYADMFNAMAKRMTERMTTEIIWNELDDNVSN